MSALVAKTVLVEAPEVDDRTERVRFALDAYFIGVERGRGFEREHPREHDIDKRRNPLFRCGCWLCRAEDVGFDVGVSSERGVS